VGERRLLSRYDFSHGTKQTGSTSALDSVPTTFASFSIFNDRIASSAVALELEQDDISGPPVPLSFTSLFHLFPRRIVSCRSVIQPFRSRPFITCRALDEHTASSWATGQKNWAWVVHILPFLGTVFLGFWFGFLCWGKIRRRVSRFCTASNCRDKTGGFLPLCLYHSPTGRRARFGSHYVALDLLRVLQRGRMDRCSKARLLSRITQPRYLLFRDSAFSRQGFTGSFGLAFPARWY